VALWEIVLPAERWALSKEWLEFATSSEERGVSRDLWNCVLLFSKEFRAEKVLQLS
jgi:hypothetical protein